MADASVKTTIPAKAIDDFCAANGVTIGSYMQAAFAETARRLARVESPFYLTVSNGRAAGSELMSCVGVKQVAAAVKKIGGVENLCLYYTAETPDQTIDQKALKDFLAETLTDFMVPTAYMQLDTMPLNANGKIDRKNLPEPKVELEEIVPPETEMEQKVFDIVSEMLKTTAFGVTSCLGIRKRLFGHTQTVVGAYANANNSVQNSLQLGTFSLL